MEIDSILKEKMWPTFETLAFQLKEQRLADITASAPQPLRTRGLLPPPGLDGLFVGTLPAAGHASTPEGLQGEGLTLHRASSLAG